MNQQPVIYVQKTNNGCLWALAAVGLLAIVAFLWMLWGTMNIAADVNQVPAVFEQAVQTLQPSNDQPGVIILATSTPFGLPTNAPTATPYPTYTAVPAQYFGDYGLPGMGPYTLDQVNQCWDIITSGNLHTLQSPQRELCVQYVGGN